MHAPIFIWACLFLIGSVSIIKCYPNSSEDDDQISLDRRSDESDSSGEWSHDSEGQKRKTESTESTSDRECKAGQLSLAPNKCTCPVGPTTSPCQIQSSGLCSAAAIRYAYPVTLITFGAGSQQYSSATPASLGFSTTYTQAINSRLIDGMFAIVNAVPADYREFLGGGLDHTPDSNAKGTKGYMMTVGVRVNAGSHTILTIPVNNLHVGLRYQFSAYIANLDKYGMKYILPNLQFQARTATADNTLVANSSTGNVPEEKTLTWKQYGMSFITPSSSIVVLVISNAPGGRGNDFAIDDISVHACSSLNDADCSKE